MPGINEVHTDRPLTNISVAYIQDQAAFVSTRVFPIVPVEKKSDEYFVWDKNDYLRDDAEPRADGAESAGGTASLSKGNYKCTVFARHEDIGPQRMKNADAPIEDLKRSATRRVSRKLLIKQEVDWASKYFVAGVWGTDLTPSDLWSDYASGDPVGDIDTAKAKILSETGFEPNKLVLGNEVYAAVRRHPDLRDQIKYTSAQTLNTDLLAQIFDVAEVVVAKAIVSTNIEGEAGAYGFTVAAKSALLCYTTDRPELEEPSAGYTFGWTGVSDGLGESVSITEEELPKTRGAIRVEGEAGWDNKIVAADLGYFFDGAVA